MEILKKIYRICQDVRSICEESWDIDPDNLSEMCAISSVFLQEVLLKYGIQTNFVMGGYSAPYVADHCWLEYEGYIIDLSAKQFNKAHPKILIRKKPIKTHRVLIPEVCARDFQSWPVYQRPKANIVAKLMRKYDIKFAIK